MVKAQEKVERERGTLNKTLPRRPDVIFGLASTVATCATVYCCRSQVTAPSGWPTVVIGSALGSFATFGGIFYANASTHSFFLGVAVFATYLVDGLVSGKDMVQTLWVAFSMSRVMLFVSLLSRLPAMRPALAIFSSSIILNPTMIVPICCLPLISFLLGGSILIVEDSIQQVYIPVGVPVLLAVATLVLCGLYYYNRSHLHGNLIIQLAQQGMIVISTLAFCYTAQYSQVNKDMAGVFLPLLVGSVITTLLSITFASVADVWNAVGSGQFQMISLDTAALLAYVVAPILVLMSIACQKYGDAVHEIVRGILKSFITEDFASHQERSPEQTLISGLYLLLSLANMIGVSLTNMLCPLGAYFMSRAYTNGQAQTRRIGLCIHFKSIIGDSKEAMSEIIDRCSAKSLQVLNIFVTADELRLFSDVIVKLKSAGHAFGICSSTVDGIPQTHDAYVEIFKTKPLWYHVGSSSAGRGPNALKAADGLDLKIAFWSTHIGVTSRDVFLHRDLIDLRQDVATNGGGSFVYVTNDWDDVQEFLFAIETIVQDLGAEARQENKFSFATLSNVAKEDLAMTL